MPFPLFSPLYSAQSFVQDAFERRLYIGEKGAAKLSTRGRSATVKMTCKQCVCLCVCVRETETERQRGMNGCSQECGSTYVEAGGWYRKSYSITLPLYHDRVSKSNPELTDVDSLASQLTLGILSGVTGGLHTHLKFAWVLGTLTFSRQAIKHRDILLLQVSCI